MIHPNCINEELFRQVVVFISQVRDKDCFERMTLVCMNKIFDGARRIHADVVVSLKIASVLDA